MVERDQQIAELRREFEGRVAHHAQQYAALESQLTEQTADLERQLAFTRQDAAEAAEQADRSLAELLATRDALSEALASAETERDRLAQESVTLSRQGTDLQSQLAERDEQLKRTQAEAHAGRGTRVFPCRRVHALGRVRLAKALEGRQTRAGRSLRLRRPSPAPISPSPCCATATRANAFEGAARCFNPRPATA